MRHQDSRSPRFRATLLGLATVAFVPLGSSAHAADSIQVWIRAFIPNAHPGNPTYVKTVPGTSGAWMIPAPSLGALNVLTQLVSDVPIGNDTCFATDNRGFSAASNASARLTTAMTVTVGGGAPSITPIAGNSAVNFPGISIAYTCSTGAVLMQKPGKVQIDAIGGPHVAAGQTQVIIDAAASLPFISGSAWVHYSADLTYDSTARTLKYNITIGRFPAFEAYAQLNNGAVKTLFTSNPEGATVWSLYDLGTGLARRTRNGTLQF